MPCRTLTASLVLTAVIATPLSAYATVATPNGLAPGSAYRLVFQTSGTIDATSGAITTYNNFANSQAFSGTGMPTTLWHAIASTAMTTALSNIACTGGNCDADPIYLTNGTEVASSTANLFSGAIMTPIDADQSGQPTQSFYVWTGSLSDGSAAPGAQLGSPNPFYGDGLRTDAAWIAEDEFDPTNPNAIYAISDELIVPGDTPVPEPASLALLAGGLAVATAIRRRRRL